MNKLGKKLLLICFLLLLTLPGCSPDRPPASPPPGQEATSPEASTSQPQQPEPAPEPDIAPDDNHLERTVLLNSGYEMPVIGLGTFTLDHATAENSVYHALKSGYRLIDTARYYKNEEGVGNGVRRAIAEGIVTREEVFITTKILPSGFSDYDAAIRASNETLGLDYIDLMLIHQQGPDEKKLYQAIERAIEEGTVRSLGISNYYTQEAFDRMIAGAEVLPAVVQNENHPYYQNTALRDYVSQYGTMVESYYPLGGRGHTQDLFQDKTIAALAQVYHKTSPQILLRWQVQAGYIPIPGSSNPEHIAENYDIFDFALTEEEMRQIAAMHTGQRYEVW